MAQTKTENDNKNNATYKTDLSERGEFVEMTICNEEEIWSDEFGNLWSVGIDIYRDFKNAIPLKND